MGHLPLRRQALAEISAKRRSRPAAALLARWRGMPSLADVADRILAHRAGRSPFLIGITGAVAAGKSTFAEQLRDLLMARGETVEIVSTDGFLMNNAALEAKGLIMRKGFPESYDVDAGCAAPSPRSAWVRRSCQAIRT